MIEPTAELKHDDLPREESFIVRVKKSLSLAGSWDVRWVTVEPLILIYMLASGVHAPALSSLTYHKVCIHKYHSTITCDNLHNSSNKHKEDYVQGVTSFWFLLHNVANELPAIFLSFLYGSLSDNFSRKLALTLPCLGQTISIFGYLLNSVFIDSHVAYLLIGQTIS